MPNRLIHGGARHPRRAAAMLLGIAAVAALAVAGLALAASPSTLNVASNVHVTNTPTKAFRVKAVNKHEAVAVGPSGFPIYTFQRETTHHIICKKTADPSTNCWLFWPPVSVKSANGITKPAGISGKLGSFHNHGQIQLTLNGQPLYYFTPDFTLKPKSLRKHEATGDELKTFGSIWHIVKATDPASGAAQPAPMSTSSTSTSTNPYPGGWG
jgi:predicted lipoprotein with Yx(FWY)xxD motif